MAYQKQTWVDYPDLSSPITSERLNHMEDGIADAWEHGGGGAGETLPIGSELDFDGNVSDIPDGWEQVDDVPVYSTTETVCGTWIDGKPLYRKVIDFGTLPSNSSKSVAHGISNLDFITHAYGVSESVQDTYFKTIPSASHSNISSQLNIAINVSNVFISTGQDSSLYTRTYIVLEYTKTTD